METDPKPSGSKENGQRISPDQKSKENGQRISPDQKSNAKELLSLPKRSDEVLPPVETAPKVCLMFFLENNLYSKLEMNLNDRRNFCKIMFV